MLRVQDLHVYYGAIHAVKGVSLEVNEGEIVTLIGANGAGKSTVLSSWLTSTAPCRPISSCSTGLSSVPRDGVFLPA